MQFYGLCHYNMAHVGKPPQEVKDLYYHVVVTKPYKLHLPQVLSDLKIQNIIISFTKSHTLYFEIKSKNCSKCSFMGLVTETW